jgi:hypothetical protein
MESSVADIEMAREGHFVSPVQPGIEYPPALKRSTGMFLSHPFKIAVALFVVVWFLTKSPLKAFLIALAEFLFYALLN